MTTILDTLKRLHAWLLEVPHAGWLCNALDYTMGRIERVR